MTEPTPSPVDRKTSLVAPIVIGAVILVLLALLLVLRGREEPAPPPPLEPPAPVPAAEPKQPPAANGPLGRGELIEAANAQAAAVAAGDQAFTGATALKGRAFVVRLPFGCDGVAGAGQLVVERDPTGRPGKLISRPANWTSLPMIVGAGTPAPERVEGFWLPRPWSFAETCPPVGNEDLPATPTPAATQTLGLAQLFEADGSRVQRRQGRAYEFTLKPATDKPAPPNGYRLVLEGRIAAFPDGRPLRCRAESPDHRPVCLYAVTLDRVAYETAGGDLLTEWRD